ncbi:hypothetical protein JHK85_005218 [Glycine max]|nr:hypothetical protein JHK85_005218 [Glycine max]
MRKCETYSPLVDSKVPSFSLRFTFHILTHSLFNFNEMGVLVVVVVSDSMEKLPNLVADIVQTSLNTGPRGVLRLAQGVQAFLGVGQEWLTDVSKSANSSTGLPTELKLGLLFPFYLRRLFERMGATYIKLGQVVRCQHSWDLSSYIHSISTNAVPFEEIESILRKELGKPLESVYEYIDPTPVASASIPQVHGARLKGSWEDVVIKEAANIEAFRRYLETMGLTGNATAPKVYQYCSTKKVLTMQRLYGVPLTDLDSISSLVSNPETSLITALNVWFGSLLACKLFHADVHAGNLWLLHDGHIGFLNFVDIVAYIFALVPTMQPQELDTEIVVATTTGTATNATAVAANVVVDERQMNALFLGVVSYFRLNLLEPKDNLFGLANHRICSSPETALVL